MSTKESDNLWIGFVIGFLVFAPGAFKLLDTFAIGLGAMLVVLMTVLISIVGGFIFFRLGLPLLTLMGWPIVEFGFYWFVLTLVMTFAAKPFSNAPENSIINACGYVSAPIAALTTFLLIRRRLRKVSAEENSALSRSD